jgi:hypothetical protein
MKRTNLLSMLALSSLLFLGVRLYAQVGLISASPVLVAHKVGRNCASNDCAVNVDLYVTIPLDAKVDSTGCLTVAHDPDDYHHDDLHAVPCGVDSAWSIFDKPASTSNQDTQIVRTIYRNRSSDRDRDAQLVVHWHLQ